MDGSTKPELHGLVAVIRLSTSANALLTHETVAEMREQLVALDTATPDVEGVVITGVGGRFVTGADYAALLDAPEGASAVAALAEEIAGLKLPTVAAFAGGCLGVGAELALACKYRVAQSASRIGFPDVAIGLAPIAGAAKRLPRLVGVDRALKLLLGGKPLSAESALKIGLVDHIAKADPAEAAVQLLTELGGRAAEARGAKVENGGAFLNVVARHRARALAAPVEAPARIVECVEAGRIVPNEIFRNMEEVAFEDLWASDHRKALAHIDQVERDAARIQRLVKPKSRPVEKIAVAGTRGSALGLTIAALEAGFDVTLADTDEDALEAGAVRVIEHFDTMVAQGRLSEAASEAVLDRLHAVSGLRTLQSADLVFDVVNARGAASKSLIADLDRVMQPGAILVTGSTQVGPDAIAAMTGRADAVLAARFPDASERRVVEVTPGTATDPLVIGTVVTVLTRMRKLPVMTAPNIRGICARMMFALHATADHLLEQGASVRTIDKVAMDWGLPLGSYAARDARGIVAPSPKTSDPGAALGLDRVLAAQGRKGKSAGRGYYIYAGGKQEDDPEITAMTDALRARKGIEPRFVSPEEIRLSLIAAMANVGAATLAEGNIARPAQLDLLSVHAMGLSRRAGGIMKSADLAGLDNLRARLKALAEEAQALPGPHPMFQKLIAAGQTFSDLNA